ncbi:MAG: deoxyribonuclease IV [Patescibacteria group bacterium]|nr:deoxyribonuclease IV [Patescibacteria group bacterium]
MVKLSIGCHVSVVGGVWNAPKNARDLGCETFQIFTRPPQGGSGAILTSDDIEKFRSEMDRYNFNSFVVHSPYYVNFGSSENRVYYGSINTVTQELARANLLGAQYVMTHVGSFKNAREEDVLKYAAEGLVKVLEKYEGKTRLLLENAAGSGNIVGDRFEELAMLMEPLAKFKTFGGICLDTQHAFASGYDLRNTSTAVEVFRQFNKEIGLKWLKMAHINDSLTDLGSRRDRHEHIGKGKIGREGFGAIMEYLASHIPALPAGRQYPDSSIMPLILETKHDTVKADVKILKQIRDKIS